MKNIVKRGILKIAKTSGKVLDGGIAVTGWGIVIVGLYGVIVLRAFRSDKLEEDKQEAGDK
jgi:hypothetical protein